MYSTRPSSPHSSRPSPSASRNAASSRLSPRRRLRLRLARRPCPVVSARLATRLVPRFFSHSLCRPRLTLRRRRVDSRLVFPFFSFRPVRMCPYPLSLRRRVVSATHCLSTLAAPSPPPSCTIPRFPLARRCPCNFEVPLAEYFASVQSEKSFAGSRSLPERSPKSASSPAHLASAGLELAWDSSEGLTDARMTTTPELRSSHPSTKVVDRIAQSDPSKPFYTFEARGPA